MEDGETIYYISNPAIVYGHLKASFRKGVNCHEKTSVVIKVVCNWKRFTEAVINPSRRSIEALRYNLNGQWVDTAPTPESAVENRLPGEFSFHLVPYSNRIEHGKLRFRGKSFSLKSIIPTGIPFMA